MEKIIINWLLTVKILMDTSFFFLFSWNPQLNQIKFDLYRLLFPVYIFEKTREIRRICLRALFSIQKNKFEKKNREIVVS